MSKIVVGMKRRPAINPHRIDCGFLKTTAMAAGGASDPVVPAALRGLPRKQKKRSSAEHQSHHSHRDPESAPCSPAPIIGPTTNWPADPPAMPNICVAPMRVAAREAGKFLVAM